MLPPFFSNIGGVWVLGQLLLCSLGLPPAAARPALSSLLPLLACRSGGPLFSGPAGGGQALGFPLLLSGLRAPIPPLPASVSSKNRGEFYRLKLKIMQLKPLFQSLKCLTNHCHVTENQYLCSSFKGNGTAPRQKRAIANNLNLNQNESNRITKNPQSRFN